MPNAIRRYVRFIDRTNEIVGLIMMYMIFLMIGILLYSSIMKTVAIPPLWTLEMAQFVMVTYYMVGGGWALKNDAHVRMDLIYANWQPRTKALIDTVTVLFLIFYLCLLLYGGFSSTSYALKYGETSYSAWSPYMAPVKIIMCFGIALTLLQAVAQLFKDIAIARGEEIS
ncbi:TRAP transporter small permease subunit [Nitratireductor pacificus]|uniref:TRAP transporter small permease protein n=1 Tax=Nitratireductor pacificus pht-3B TaxID=391937 RepID=K2LKJ6_9HYPH|nr:TRAP transporter small permease subunit [Nitratireductor pacificus]EKF18259.1 tripartite ATP-independent periplasmic transporter DctQ [Nitratireductor pacificus pht-3B]